MSDLILLGIALALNRSLKHDLRLKRGTVCDGDEEVSRRRLYKLAS